MRKSTLEKCIMQKFVLGKCIFYRVCPALILALPVVKKGLLFGWAGSNAIEPFQVGWMSFGRVGKTFGVTQMS